MLQHQSLGYNIKKILFMIMIISQDSTLIEGAQSIEYVDMVIQESLRMYPAAPMYGYAKKKGKNNFFNIIEQQEKLPEILK